MDTIGIGIIGAGYMGRTHSLHYSQVKDVEIVAVADINQEAANELAHQHRIPHVYQDFEELLTNPKVDAVSICTPDAMHLAPCLRAAAMGKHMLLEKPIATTMEDAHAILGAVDKAGTTLLMGFVSRYLKTYTTAHQNLEQGKLGDVLTVAAKRVNRSSVGSFYSKRGDNIIGFLGIHDIDLLRWFGGEVVSVYAEAGAFVFSEHGPESLDTAMILVRFDSGAIGYVHSSWALPDSVPYRATSTFEVIGKKGTALIDAFDQSVRIASDSGYEIPNAWDISQAFRAQALHFVECVRGRETPRITGYDGLKALEVANAALISAREKRPVNL